MTQTSFAEVKAAFDADNDLRDFKCIGTPYGRICANEIDVDQKANLKQLLRIPQDDLSLDNVRDIINCLLCAADQRTFTHKNKVEIHWKDEFQSLDFTLRRSPSPLSLDPKRKTSGSRRRSDATPSASSARSTPSTGSTNRSVYLQPPPTFPHLASTSHHRSSSAPNIFPTPNFEVARESNRAQQATDDDVFMVTVDQSSPPQHGRHAIPQSYRHPEGGNEQANFDVDEVHIEIPHRDGVAQELAPDSELSQAMDDTVSAQEQNPFHPGDASTWAPWTIRSDVLAVLLEPLPKAETKGSIYAVQVSSTPYVKIGYTTRKVKTRLSEIAAQHGQSLDMPTAYWLPGIPLLQLLRLEALVHTDLAYFQRDLRLRSGRSQRTHREYFEVDLATAQRTIKMWWKVMKDIRLEPGRELDTELVEAVRGDSALDVEMSDDALTSAPPESWHDLNTDHRRREGIWDTVFRVKQGGFKRSRWWKTFAWCIGLSIVGLLFDMVRQSSLVIFCSIAGFAMVSRLCFGELLMWPGLGLVSFLD